VPEITRLLKAWGEGRPEAEHALMTALYPLLKDVARRQLGKGGGQLTLQATDLLHSAYERLQPDDSIEWRDRSHFLAVASVLIRNTLIDHLRRRSSLKRGGDVSHGSLQEEALDPVDPALGPEAALNLDTALARLADIDAACAQVVLLKVFAGHSNEEIAQALEISTATVVRHWRFARAWLSEQL
jgi:RNA polymerase sigma factor (TIGR02999 family)